MTSFGVLGPLRVMHAGHTVRLGGPKQRTLLAALLLRARKPVSRAGIVEALWGGCPPPSGAANVHTHVNRLRGAFADAGLAGLLVTEGGGYRLLAEAHQLDSETFKAAAGRGRAALAAGDARRAVAFWQEAWAVWRGDPLEDVPTAGWLDDEAMRLAELVASAREDFADARLAAGQYAALVAELTPVARAQPLREGLWRRLMLAQFRAGRRAEALETYRVLRGALVEELGVEPCGEIQELHQRILRDGPANHVRPMQLPPDTENFTGRRIERAECRRLLTTRPQPVAAITGKAGVGKSALAVRVAHELDDHFHGGQLYVRLGGPRSPRDPVTVLAELLIALGVHPHAVPDDPEARAALYRSQLAARRVLIVLDDAANMAQVRPLLPGTAGSAVLITSRVQLLEAHALHLDVLDATDAVRLLASIAGRSRLAGEPDAAAAVARYCGNLPLALRIAGSRLARRPHWTVSRLAERLVDEGTRLNELSIGDLEARASLALSYEALGEEQRRAFRLLSLLDVPDFPSWVAGPMLAVPDAEELVDGLADVHLLEPAGRGRYRFHDLLRVFGREKAGEHDSATERADAIRRAFTAWLDLAVRAEVGLPSRFLKVRLEVEPSLVDEDAASRLLADPLAFLETERNALVAVVEQAVGTATLGMTTLGVDMACVFTTMFDLRSHYDLWRHTHELALAAATEARHRAILYQGLGALAVHRDRLPDADSQFARARRIFADLGDIRGHAYATLGLGTVRMLRSSHDDAAVLLARAKAGFRRSADAYGAAFALQALGVVRRNQGRLDDAARFLGQALESFRELHCAYGQACVLFSLGLHHAVRGDLKSSERVLMESVELFRSASCPRDEALALHVLAATHAQDGDAGRASALMSRSLAVFSPADESPAQAAMLYSLGWVAHRNHRPGEAIRHFHQALHLYEKLDLPMPQAKVRTALHSLGLSAAAESPAEAWTRR